jgi:hypothetical protein
LKDLPRNNKSYAAQYWLAYIKANRFLFFLNLSMFSQYFGQFFRLKRKKKALIHLLLFERKRSKNKNEVP